MKAYFLHISINFSGEVPQDALKKKLDLALDWIHYMPNCWIVRTTSDTKKWLDRFSTVLSLEDSMLVVKMELPTQAHRLPGYVADWIEKYLPKSTP